jgi:hypothetical protein
LSTLRNKESLLNDMDQASRAAALDALRWRPRFLAHYAIANNLTLAARMAGVGRVTVHNHRHRDTQFAELVAAAKEEALDLLEAVTWKRSVEGDIEPVFYMGVPVAYIRKYDSKLQVELLRAHRPATYKTPGVNLNIGAKGDVFVLTEEQRHILMDYKRRELLASPPPPAQLDAGDAPGTVCAQTTPSTCDENITENKNSLG